MEIWTTQLIQKKQRRWNKERFTLSDGTPITDCFETEVSFVDLIRNELKTSRGRRWIVYTLAEEMVLASLGRKLHLTADPAVEFLRLITSHFNTGERRFVVEKVTQHVPDENITGKTVFRLALRIFE